jgi:hypothetical protein
MEERESCVSIIIIIIIIIIKKLIFIGSCVHPGPGYGSSLQEVVAEVSKLIEHELICMSGLELN